MFELGKYILVTSNDRATREWGDSINHAFMIDTYEEMLRKTRDLIYTRHRLLTHPQASSLRPNQTPYRTVLLYGIRGSGGAESVCLIKNTLETYEEWNSIKKIPGYDEKTAYDYKTVDSSMIENVTPRLQGMDCSD